MKLNAAKIQECAAWVELNGLHPQPCGAKIKVFCEAMGISDETWRRWQRNVAFVDAISRARDLFATQTVREVENALVRAAKGIDFEKTRQEMRTAKVVVEDLDPATGKVIRRTTTTEMRPYKAAKERVYYPPDVRAAQFVLTNLAPEVWKNRQEQTVRTTEGGAVQITVGSAEVQDALGKVLAAGAAPRKPETPQDDNKQDA